MTENKRYLKLFDEQGHLNDEGTACYASSLLNKDLQELPEELLIHVMECYSCKENCLELAEILRQDSSSIYELNDNEDIKPPGKDYIKPGIKPGVDKRRYYPLQLFKVAATILIVAGIGWLIMFWMRSMKDENVKLADNQGLNDTAIGKVKQLKITAIQNCIERWAGLNPGNKECYQLNSKLEGMLKLVFRTNNFQVIVPDSISEYYQGNPLIFRWDNKSGKELILKIMNWNGVLVHQRSLKHHNEYQFNRTLEPGLYYWFVEQSNYTVAAGRIGVLMPQ